MKNRESDPALVPELAVKDLSRSLSFWRDLLGFEVRYERPDEGFAYLDNHGAHVMLDQIGIGRTWRTGDLEAPLGRGMNLQVSVAAIGPIIDRLSAASWTLFLRPEEKWYAVGTDEVGVCQFLVQDPDGYLIRIQQSVGRQSLS